MGKHGRLVSMVDQSSLTSSDGSQRIAGKLGAMCTFSLFLFLLDRRWNVTCSLRVFSPGRIARRGHVEPVRTLVNQIIDLAV